MRTILQTKIVIQFLYSFFHGVIFKPFGVINKISMVSIKRETTAILLRFVVTADTKFVVLWISEYELKCGVRYSRSSGLGYFCSVPGVMRDCLLPFSFPSVSSSTLVELRY